MNKRNISNNSNNSNNCNNCNNCNNSNKCCNNENTITNYAVIITKELLTPCQRLQLQRCGIELDDDTILLKTFNDNILYPTNIDDFCIDNIDSTKPLCISYKDITDEECSNEIDTMIVKLCNVKKLHKMYIRKTRGIVSKEFDLNGEHYRLTEIFRELNVCPEKRLPIRNRLRRLPIVINYEIINILDTKNPIALLEALKGKVIEITYVDYGKETNKRLGIPIVILKHKLVNVN
jgi:hypothetical protein